MPRGNQINPMHQLARVLLIGDGKCGKSDWAARAVADGFDVLYLDADVGIQTIAGLSKDKVNPVSAAAMERIFVLNVEDILINGGMDFRFVSFFKRFTTTSTFKWNDTKGREYSPVQDGDETSDSIWEIKPGSMDHNCVLVVDSWTSLVQSAMGQIAEDVGVDLGDLSKSDRNQEMRGIYQAAGEKLTQFLIMIRSAPCHVIVIAHPNEFVKTEKPQNKTLKQIPEGDLKVLWTKMVPKSSSNNHAMTMAKYFTDLAWLEVDALGDFKIDFRASNDRISGSHINAVLKCRSDGSFANLVRAIGGTVPDGSQPTDHWITIHDSGYKLAEQIKSPQLVLRAQKSEIQGAPDSQGSQIPAVKPLGLNLNVRKS